MQEQTIVLAQAPRHPTQSEQHHGHHQTIQLLFLLLAHYQKPVFLHHLVFATIDV